MTEQFKNFWRKSASENVHLNPGSPRPRTRKMKSSRRIRRVFFHHFKTHRRMLVEQEMISGPCQETSYTAITLNPQSKCTCRKKNHSPFHRNTLTWPELQVRPWMWCLKAAETIIGISKESETNQTRGQVSHDSLYWTRNLQMGTHGPGGGWRRKQTTSRSDYLWPEIWKDMSAAAQRKEKQKWAVEKTEAWQRWEIARYLLHWSSGCGVQRNDLFIYLCIYFIYPAWELTKVKNNNEVVAEARKEGKTVHFASLMDICHLKNSELEPQFQKYEGRVVLTV